MIHCVRQIFISRCTSRHSGPEYQYRITKHYSAACKIIKYMVEIKGRHHLYNESQARSCSHLRTYTVANAKSVDIYMNTSTQIVLPAPVLLGLPIDRSPIYQSWRWNTKIPLCDRLPWIRTSRLFNLLKYTEPTYWKVNAIFVQTSLQLRTRWYVDYRLICIITLRGIPAFSQEESCRVIIPRATVEH